LDVSFSRASQPRYRGNYCVHAKDTGMLLCLRKLKFKVSRRIYFIQTLGHQVLCRDFLSDNVLLEVKGPLCRNGLSAFIHLGVTEVVKTPSSMGMVPCHRYLLTQAANVTIIKLLDSIFNILPVFILRWKFGKIYTGLFFRKR
jgi:hypothetical protein